MATSSSPPLRMLITLLFVGSALLVTPRGAHAATAVAAPATPAVAAACAQAVVAARATQDEVIPISGLGRLSGCVADTSGIDRILVGWTRDGSTDHARLCTDPAVVNGVWNCTWDTTDLPRGRYSVRLVAIDAAGNQGTFTRRYDVRDIEAGADPAAPAAPVAPPTADSIPGDGADAAAESDSSAPESGSPAPDTNAAAPIAAPDVKTPAVAEFSPTQRLVLDRIATCEHGGDETTPTDADNIVTQVEQATAVAACLRPATDAAGASAIGLDADIPVPPTVRVTVATQQLLTELAAVLPDQVGGVPVVLHLMTDAERAEADALTAMTAP